MATLEDVDMKSFFSGFVLGFIIGLPVGYLVALGVIYLMPILM